MARGNPRLSPLEHQVMQVIWSRGSCSAEEIRQTLSADRSLKDSTVRTLLRRIEQKGYLTHRREHRTNIYGASIPPQQAAVSAVRQIVDRFCGGSVEMLLVGMVREELLDGDQLRQLVEKIDQLAEGEEGER